MSFVSCTKLDGQDGEFEVDLTNPLVIVLLLDDMLRNVIPNNDVIGINHLTRKWCAERGFRIRHYYEKIDVRIIRKAMMALHFETPSDAVLFKLSWARG